MAAIVSTTSRTKLVQLGQRLRKVRLDRGDTMAQFAKDLGISVSTLQRMEKGHPGVTIGLWAETFRRLQHLNDLDFMLNHPSLQSLGHPFQTKRLRTRAIRPM